MLKVDNWKSALCSLCHLEGKDFSLVEDNQEIRIIASSEILTKIQRVLSDPATIQSQTAYTLQSTHNAIQLIPAEQPLYFPPKPADFVNGVRFFEQLFDQDLRAEIGNEFKWEELSGVNKVAIFKCLKKSSLIKRQLISAQFEAYRKILTMLTFKELRAAIAEHQAVPIKTMPIEDNSNTGLLSEKIAHLILSVRETEDKTADVYQLDWGLFLRCLVSPVETLAEVTTSLTIPKEHLLNFLGTCVFPERAIFSLSTGDAQATPLFWPGPVTTEKLEHEIILVLDCSKSMESCFQSYMQHVEALIKKLCKELPDALLTIIPFSTQVSNTAFFSISDINHNKKIVDYLNGLKASGKTRLYGALTQALKRQDLQNNKERVIIVASDGIDNQSTTLEKDSVQQTLTEMKSKENPPKVYTIGIGDSYEKSCFQQLSELTGTEPIEVQQGLANFTKIEEHVKNMACQRALRRLVLNSTQHTITAYAGALTAGPQIPIGTTFSLDNNLYTLHQQVPTVLPTVPRDPDLVPVAVSEKEVAQQLQVETWSEYFYNAPIRIAGQVSGLVHHYWYSFWQKTPTVGNQTSALANKFEQQPNCHAVRYSSRG